MMAMFPEADVEGQIGDRLREAVNLAGGPAAVARRVGMVPQTLNKYLTGTALRLSTAARLAEVCGVRLEWLATGKLPMRPGGVIDFAPPKIALKDADPRILGLALEAWQGLKPSEFLELDVSGALLAALYDTAYEAQHGEASRKLSQQYVSPRSYGKAQGLLRSFIEEDISKGEARGLLGSLMEDSKPKGAPTKK